MKIYLNFCDTYFIYIYIYMFKIEYIFYKIFTPNIFQLDKDYN